MAQEATFMLYSPQDFLAGPDRPQALLRDVLAAFHAYLIMIEEQDAAASSNAAASSSAAAAAAAS
jgi:hypothetical protein